MQRQLEISNQVDRNDLKVIKDEVGGSVVWPNVAMHVGRTAKYSGEMCLLSSWHRGGLGCCTPRHWEGKKRARMHMDACNADCVPGRNAGQRKLPLSSMQCGLPNEWRSRLRTGSVVFGRVSVVQSL